MEIFTSTETMMIKGFAKYKWVQVLCVNNINIIRATLDRYRALN